jgi:hypothetical protein
MFDNLSLRYSNNVQGKQEAIVEINDVKTIRETRELGTVRGRAGHSATPPSHARGQIAIQDAKRNFVPSCAAGVGGGVASLRVAGTTRPASRITFTSFYFYSALLVRDNKHTKIYI